MKNKKVPYPLIFPILFPFTVVGMIVSFIEIPDPSVRYIKVNGQNCTIKYVRDRCTSHGFCMGHDEAVCP